MQQHSKMLIKLLKSQRHLVYNALSAKLDVDVVKKCITEDRQVLVPVEKLIEANMTKISQFIEANMTKIS